MTLGVWFETEDSRGGGSTEERESQLLAVFNCSITVAQYVMSLYALSSCVWHGGRAEDPLSSATVTNRTLFALPHVSLVRMFRSGSLE